MILPTPEQKAQWEEEGYLVFENAIQGEDLKRLQNAFDYWADACKAEWLDRVEAGKPLQPSMTSRIRLRRIQSLLILSTIRVTTVH